MNEDIINRACKLEISPHDLQPTRQIIAELIAEVNYLKGLLDGRDEGKEEWAEIAELLGSSV